MFRFPLPSWDAHGSSHRTRRFLYATGDAGLPEPVSEYDGGNTLKHHYGWGPGPDEPLLWWDGDAGFALRSLALGGLPS